MAPALFEGIALAEGDQEVPALGRKDQLVRGRAPGGTVPQAAAGPTAAPSRCPDRGVSRARLPCHGKNPAGAGSGRPGRSAPANRGPREFGRYRELRPKPRKSIQTIAAQIISIHMLLFIRSPA
jgi:hypothetical protein